jgi:hypothetical protein
MKHERQRSASVNNYRIYNLNDRRHSNSSSTAAADLEYYGSIKWALVELKKKATLVDIDCN